MWGGKPFIGMEIANYLTDTEILLGDQRSVASRQYGSAVYDVCDFDILVFFLVLLFCLFCFFVFVFVMQGSENNIRSGLSVAISDAISG